MGSQGSSVLWQIGMFWDFHEFTTTDLCLPLDGQCGDVTGLWVLDRSTVPMPIPSTLLLTGIGLLHVRRFMSQSQVGLAARPAPSERLLSSP